MAVTLPTKKLKLHKTGLIICLLIILEGKGMGSERLWDRSRIPKDNVALQFVPLDAAETDRQLDAIREHFPQDRNQKPETDYLADAHFRAAVTRLLDFYSLALVYYMEGEAGDADSPFGLARQKPRAEYQKEYRDFMELMVNWGIHPPTTELGGITATLARLNDERALPILARLYFFQSRTRIEGGDMIITGPSGYAHLPMLMLTTRVKSQLFASLPKADHSTWGKNYHDEVRKWILANKAAVLPDGVPKFANVQEGPFLEYIARQEAAALANPKPVEGYAGYNGFRTPENSRLIILAARIVGASLFVMLGWMLWKRTSRKR